MKYYVYFSINSTILSVFYFKKIFKEITAAQIDYISFDLPDLE